MRTLILSIILILNGAAAAIAQEKPYVAKGKASYYADKFHGRLTANGERFNQQAMTAAHLKLPFNTWVKVTNLSNDKSVIVRINDRGPYVRGRIIDLSKAAAQKLGFIHKGVTKVLVEQVDEAGRSKELPTPVEPKKVNTSPPSSLGLKVSIKKK